MNRNKLANGFTLVELMVVIAIVTLLLAISLPVIFGARESARLSACLSNQRQIGIGLQNYETAFGVFPVGASRNSGDAGFGMLPRVLPFLDQAATSQKIDWRVSPMGSYKLDEIPLTSAFQCGSDGEADRYSLSYAVNGGVDAGMFNPQLVDSRFLGAFDYGVPTRSSSFEDGLSNTAMLAERLVGTVRGPLAGNQSSTGGLPFRDLADIKDAIVPVGQPNRFIQKCSEITNKHQDWVRSYGRHWQLFHHYTHTQTPNSAILDCGRSITYPMAGVITARSNHRSSVTVCFADGHVETVANTIDVEVWRDLGSRAGKRTSPLAQSLPSNN